MAKKRLFDDDDFIEVDDSELVIGDDNKIDISAITVDDKSDKSEEKDGDSSEDKTEIPDDGLIDTDEFLSNQTDDEDDKKTDDSDDDKDDESENKSDDDKGEDDTDDDKGEDDDTPVGNEFTVWSKNLAEKGFFPDIDEETLTKIESEDDLTEVLQNQLITTFNQWKDGYRQNLVPNLIADGVIDPNMVKKGPTVYSDEQIKGNLDVAKNVIRNYYKRTNVPEKEIERIIESREDLEESAIELNKLNQQAEEADKVKLAEQMKQRELEAQKKREEDTRMLRDNTFAYDEFIPGKKLRKQDKEDAFANIIPTLNKVNSNLAKYAPILAYLDKYGILEGDFKKVTTQSKSKAVNDLSRVLNEKKSGKGTHKRTTSSGSKIQIDNSDVNSIYK